MKKRIPVWLSIIALCASLALPEFSAGPSVQVAAAGPKADVSEAVHHDTSPPLREMAAKATPTPKGAPSVLPVGAIPSPGGSEANVKDPVLQASLKGPKVGTTAGLNFAGVGQDDYGFSDNYIPPDTNGAVGATQYVQWVNANFAVFNKSTGAVMLNPTPGNALWTGFGGGCEVNNNGDPLVKYDQMAGRWVLSQFSVSNPTTYHYLQCVAISTSSDAMGTYYRYAFDYGPTAFNDYGKLGVWPDGYYITYNIFNGKPDAPNGPLSTFGGAKTCAFNRTAMLTGATATQQCFDLGTSYGGVLPSDLDGKTLPPAGSPNFLLNFGTNSLNLWKFHVDWTTPANTTITGPTSIPVAAFSEACGGSNCIPQPSPGSLLDSLADRLMYRLAYRNFGDHESLVVNHSVTAGTSASGIRWYELWNPNGTVVVRQAGTYGGDGTSRWMGSIAMDQSGNMALGYSASSSTLYPSIAYTGRLASDPLGTMEAEALITAGGGAQTVATRQRWGDYSAMSVDPVDDCTFWYTQEYLKTTGVFNWSTRIASFHFPSCAQPTTLHVSGATNSAVSFGWTNANTYSATALGIGTTGGTTYHGLAPGVATYTQPVAAGYWACAQAASYNAVYASSFTPWTCGLAIPNAPTGIHVTGHTPTSVSFAWTDGDPYSGIAVSNGVTVSTVPAGGTTYTQNGMTTGNWVCVSLAAYNSSGASPWTASTTGWVCGQAT